MLAGAGCGGGDESTTVAGFDPEIGLDGVVDCLTGEGWSETGKATGTAGTSYTVDSEAGTSVLLSTYLPDEEPALDSTTFAIAASDPEMESMSVEVIIGSITDEERGQIDGCAAG
jgi:hypothetical protein